MSDAGVVDPIRIPPWLREPVERAWRESSVVVRAFVILAFVDVVSRSLGILQPRYVVGLDLFGLYAMLIPHDLWILLPAVLVLRRPDAARATPLVFAGAVTIALVTAFERPVQSWFEGPFGANTLSVEIGILGSLATLVAWLLIARGLAALSPVRPSPSIAGLSNLVLGLGLAALLLSLARDLTDVPETGVPGLDGLLILSNLVAYARLTAWLYLLWIVIRGVGDGRRPEMAIVAGAVGAAMTGLLDAVALAIGAVMTLSGSSGAPGSGLDLPNLSFAFGFLSMGIGQALVVVAFAFGLAEPPVPYVAPADRPADAGDEAAADTEPAADAAVDAEARAST